MKWFYKTEKYTEEDLIQYSKDHYDAALYLFGGSHSFLDSAGCLLHYAFELLFKAFHLHYFQKHNDSHKLIELYLKLSEHRYVHRLGKNQKILLAELADFFDLRYPGKLVEVGSDNVPKVIKLYDRLFAQVPSIIFQELKNRNRDRIIKGGRILMSKERRKKRRVNS